MNTSTNNTKGKAMQASSKSALRWCGMVLMFTGIIVGTMGSANAKPKPTPTQTASQYITVVWQMPSWTGTHTPVWPQTLVSQTTEQTETLDVTVPDTCGTQYQIDSYVQDKLPKSGLPNTLHRGDDTGWLAPGSWGVAYRLVHNVACESSSAPPSSSSVPPSSSSVVLSTSPVTSKPVVSTSASAITSTVATTTTHASATKHVLVANRQAPKPPLASTGFDSTEALVFGLALFLIGAVLTAFGYSGTKLARRPVRRH